MDNRCLIIMPTQEPAGYASGHFGRVYDYVVVPACRAAGYWPTRLDTVVSDNSLTVLKDVIDCEVVLCDLSAANSEALYGLAIRHSLDLPVVVAKDSKSFILFDATDFGLVEYDDSLRIDTVQKAIENLSAVLKKAVENKKERNTLLNRLSIGLPPAPVKQEVAETSASTSQPSMEETVAKDHQLPIISPLPDYVGDPFTEEQLTKLKGGDHLFHLHHGEGKINFIKNAGKDRLANIQFDSGTKFLVLLASDFFRKVNK